MPNLSEQYRLKAVACEMRAVEAKEQAIKTAWTEIAIEWHALAFRIAQDVEADERRPSLIDSVVALPPKI
jgi:hypothetical protein